MKRTNEKFTLAAYYSSIFANMLNTMNFKRFHKMTAIFLVWYSLFFFIHSLSIVIMLSFLLLSMKIKVSHRRNALVYAGDTMHVSWRVLIFVYGYICWCTRLSLHSTRSDKTSKLVHLTRLLLI